MQHVYLITSCVYYNIVCCTYIGTVCRPLAMSWLSSHDSAGCSRPDISLFNPCTSRLQSNIFLHIIPCIVSCSRLHLRSHSGEGYDKMSKTSRLQRFLIAILFLVPNAIPNPIDTTRNKRFSLLPPPGPSAVTFPKKNARI